MSSQGPLTSWLLSATPEAFKRATTHPFLASAGRGTLPKSTLSQWLAQDRLYAQSYIRFIGLLLAKIRMPAHKANSAFPLKPSSEQRAVEVLIDALVNIRTELKFFEETATAYGLDLTAISAEEGGESLAESGSGSITTSAGISTTGSGSCPGSTGVACGSKNISTAAADEGEMEGVRAEGHGLCGAQGECQMQAGNEVCNPSSPPKPQQGTNAAEGEQPCLPSGGHPVSAAPLERGGPIYFAATCITRAYIDMFMSAGSTGASLLEGLAVLWATEVCYLRSWRYAASYLKLRDGQGQDDADGGALRDKFIPNWSSVEFEDFVNRIGDVLDEMAGETKGWEEAEMMRGRCLEWWRQVVWLEERFWPAMD
ncbi:uncharacterized protein N7477_000483 [Penicillium maclennaniae]|uniref:uncharacterized protein n=1 Tax=Penicillium maclennaniae TaxID=1343394 RepID=UPI00254124C8|nr:uncharacterized protein N7477_000483 [Penicillium maclennaniae]KAJ5684138.1 hypothetical protein N7477_000483 [Penicillium maclennaniae]